MKGNLKRLLSIFLVLMLLSADICTIAEAAATLTLPSALQIIEEEAFAGNTSIEKVIVPDGTTEIRGRAFADSSMTELDLPDSLTFIAENAFEDCGEFTLTVPENCYAYDRCVELGLIKSEEPDPSVIESAHPYPDDFDYTWTYDAGEGIESVTITFSADTETEEDYDFIYLYTLDGVQAGKYSGTELAGQSVTVDGAGFKLRLVSDEALDGSNTFYGFKLDSIAPKKYVALTVESVTADNNAVIAGEAIRWTVETSGGKEPVFFDYTILMGEEEVAFGTVEAPDVIEYTPLRAGTYRASVSVRDSISTVPEAFVSEAVIAAPTSSYPESPHPYYERWEDSWFYAAEENVQSLSITFSEETSLEEHDPLCLYDQDGTLLQTYWNDDLAGRTIEIMGNAFSLTLSNGDALTDYGFSITNIEKYVSSPLSFVSLTAERNKAKVGEVVAWTMETEGGDLPVTYEYTISSGGEIHSTGTATRPDPITFVPSEAGDYTLSVVAKDGTGHSLDAQTSVVRVAAEDPTPEEDFTYTVLNGLQASITGYTGEDVNVIVPDTIDGYEVAEIGDSAFLNHDSLVSISLPATITHIDQYAFCNCAALQGVTMEEGLLSVGNSAFENCDSLRSIAFPDSVTTLGSRVLFHCDQLSYVHFPLSWETAGGEIISDCPRMTRIKLPEVMTTVPENAFRRSNHLMEIDFPSTLLEIQTNAFRDCTRLKQLDLPEGLETIQQDAFGSTGLTSIDVPSSVTCLSGFYGCTKLTNVHLHEGLEEIGTDAFHSCTNLVGLEIPEGVRTIGYNAFYNCERLKAIDLPDSVTTINENAFYNCKSLESFGYPLGWTTVNGVDIFVGCEKLTSVTIPEGVTEIPACAFAGNVYLREVIFPSTLEVIGDNAFSDCAGLTEIVLPPNVTKIGFWAFSACSNLRNIIFNDVLEEMKAGAFGYCTSLTEVNLPDSVEAIGEQCFEGCSSLKTFGYPLGWTRVTSRHDNDMLYGGDVFTGCEKLTSITIPEGVTTIPNNAFEGHDSLTEINFPSTLTTIECDAFRRCTGLSVVELPGNLRTIRLNAFRDCNNLRDVIFNDGLESVQAGAFAYCTSLVEADLPDSVKEIGELCFEYCSSLETFNYPLSWERVTSRYDNDELYGGGTFDECEKLTAIDIPEGVTAIPDYAFAGANYVTEVSLPSTLEVLGRWAFERCTALTHVELPASLRIVGLRAFYDCHMLEEAVFNDGLEEIHAGAFGNCYALLKADLPHSVRTIGEECFINCVSLGSFNYPLSLEYVGSRYENGALYGGNCFTDCESLTSVIVPEGVKHIPAALFESANYLQSVTLPSTLTSIGSTAFAGCSILPMIYLSPEVTEIYDNAFDNCPELTIWTEYGAYALQHAIDREIPYYYLTPDGVNIPSGTLYKGDDFNVYGYARASVPLTDVTATIWDSSGTNVVQTISVNPGILDYDLSDTVNAHLLFSELPLGSYRFTLRAKTDVSEEFWADTGFTIVPPPLRVYVSGLDGLTGAVGNDFAFGGMIYSNYPMTSIAVTLKNVSTDTVYANFTCAPNTTSYSLTGTTGINFAQLPTGNYRLTIVVSGNGETRTPADAFFSIGAYDQEISGDVFDQLVSFAGNLENQMIFSQFNEGSAFLGSLDWSDELFMAIRFRSQMCINAISQKLTSSDLSYFMVERYKKEVASIIDELDPTIDLTDSSSMYIEMVESLNKNLRIVTYVDNEDGLVPKYMKEMSKKINTQLDDLEKVCDVAKWVTDSQNGYSSFLKNYENSLMILEAYGYSMGTTNPELEAAITELAEDYTSKVSKALNLMTTMLIDNMSKQMYSAGLKLFQNSTSLLNQAITGSAGNYSIMLSVVNFAIDATLELNNLDKIADNQMNAMIQIETFGQAVDSYYHAFITVYEGDTSSYALNRLAICYQLCCISGTRMYESLAKTAWYEKNYGANDAFMSKYAELWRLEYAEPFDRWR